MVLKGKSCPPEGTLVKFTPNPVSMVLYSKGHCAEPGEVGRVVSLPFPGSRRTCMPGPGGGLVYVRWASGCTQGTSRYDLEKVK